MATNRTPKKRTAPDWAPRFLECLSLTANIKAACRAANISRSAFYDRRDSDTAFAQAVVLSLDEAIDELELEARRRAYHGLRRVKFHQGTPIMVQAIGADGKPIVNEQGQPVFTPYTEHEYSDTLMIFLLKSHRPEKYRERYEVKHGGSVNFTLEQAVEADQELEQWQQAQKQIKAESK